MTCKLAINIYLNYKLNYYLNHTVLATAVLGNTAPLYRNARESQFQSNIIF